MLWRPPGPLAFLRRAPHWLGVASAGSHHLPRCRRNAYRPRSDAVLPSKLVALPSFVYDDVRGEACVATCAAVLETRSKNTMNRGDAMGGPKGTGRPPHCARGSATSYHCMLFVFHVFFKSCATRKTVEWSDCHVVRCRVACNSRFSPFQFWCLVLDSMTGRRGCGDLCSRGKNRTHKTRNRPRHLFSRHDFRRKLVYPPPLSSRIYLCRSRSPKTHQESEKKTKNKKPKHLKTPFPPTLFPRRQ